MTKDRKQALLQLLKEAPKALNGQSLAEHFHVTRQVIVQDIAILRADGAPILSTNVATSISKLKPTLMFTNFSK